MLPMVSGEFKVVGDPSLRFSPGGVAVGGIRCVSNSRKKVNEEWVNDKTCWLDVTCFGTLAENVAESIRNGDNIVVTGKLQTEEWEDKEGNKRSKQAVIADEIAMSLRWRTVHHGQDTSRTRASTDAPDPWATTPPATTDEPPF